MSSEPLIPEEVEAAYFPAGADVIRQLVGGIINATLVVETVPEEKLIIQRLSPIFDPKMLDDYQVVAEHLKADGWEIPALLPTASGKLYETDGSGNLWRAFEYIEADTAPNNFEPGSATAYGFLLGRLHASLAKLDYRPVFGLPHFHDTAFYAEALSTVESELPSLEAKQLAHKLLDSYHRLPVMPQTGEQLIHGDPRTVNILSRQSEPFTFIDWDTLMHGTIWIDIGDMLRSVAEDAIMAGLAFPIDSLLEVIDGYYQSGHFSGGAETFRQAALVAAQVIALELAMRFAADYKAGPEGYFTWDEAKYSDRHTHNMERARLQWQIFEQLKEVNHGR